MPFYPLLSFSLNGKNVYDFYRRNIDESTILSSYLEEYDKIVSKETFLSVDTVVGSKMDLKGVNEISNYSVVSGDSFGKISQKFGVSVETILWANNLKSSSVLHPGDTLKIPPVSGLIHNISAGETLASISKKYGVNEENIVKQNELKNGLIVVGKDIVIPGAIKKPDPKPIVKKDLLAKVEQKNNKKSNNKNNSKATAKNSNPKVTLKAATGGYNRFYRGNCTRYVANNVKVTWGGNANRWLRNARAAGRSTGKTAAAGSIIVFQGRGYNPRYGHVGIVREVGSDYLIIADMNYRKLGEVTVRKIDRYDGAIKGYIY